MLTEQEEFELLVMSIISEAREPIGSGSLAEGLRRHGQLVSEATAGRVLRDLDNKGLTGKDGFRGRCLSAEGQRRLTSLRQAKSRAESGEELLRSLAIERPEELIDVMVARRAIEREIVRLAAGNAGSEEIRRLHAIIDEQARLIDQGLTAAKHDREFHRALGKIAGNAVLEAALELIRQDERITRAVEIVRAQVKSSMVTDHRAIVRALEAQDADQAEALMVTHIEGIIFDVARYSHSVKETSLEGAGAAGEPAS